MKNGCDYVIKNNYLLKMSNVQLNLAKDATFQNLVVKGQSTFESGAFNRLKAGLVDAESVSIDSLTVTTLNQSNSIGNPFAGVTLTPNELVALTSTKSLTTFPYSQAATDGSVIQRTSTNSVNANFLAGSGPSNQLVLGSGNTVTINAVQNGFSGGLGIGGSISSVQWLLSGDSTVINSRSGINLLSINEDAGGAAMQIRVLLDVANGQESSLSYRQGGVQKWTLTCADLGGGDIELELRKTGSLPLVFFGMGDPGSSATLIEGNIIPVGPANSFALGDTLHRYERIFLSTESVTQLTNINTTMTFGKTSGLGTTVANPNVPFQGGAGSSQAFGLTNPAIIAASEFMIALTGAGFTASVTTPIPIFQYSALTNQIFLINAQTNALGTLSTAVTFSFVVLNANGSGP